MCEKCESERVSHSVMSNSLRPHRLQLTRLLCPLNFPSKNTGVGSHSLLQGIFLTQGSNPGLLHCRQIIYLPSHEGSPSICWRLPRFSLWSKTLLLILDSFIHSSIHPSIEYLHLYVSKITWPPNIQNYMCIFPPKRALDEVFLLLVDDFIIHLISEASVILSMSVFISFHIQSVTMSCGF